MRNLLLILPFLLHNLLEEEVELYNRSNAGELGDYKELAVLPDKIAVRISCR
jgi:hypothetical protein